MPKRILEMTALEVSRLRVEGSHAVGGVSGLYLRIEAVSTASRHPSIWDIEARTHAILWTADPNLR